MPVRGGDDIRRKLNTLVGDVRGRAGVRMVASGANVLRKEAKIVAQARGLKVSGAMIKNIALKREKEAKGGLIQYNVGVRHGHNLAQKKAHVIRRRKENPSFVGVRNGRYLDDPWYWWIVHSGRNIYKTGKRRSPVIGRVAGVPFFTIALANKSTRVEQVMGEVLEGVIGKVSR